MASSGMMDDYEFDEDDDDALTTPATASEESAPYVCLRPEDIVEEQLVAVSEVNSIMGISPSVAKALLMHCKWDKDRLLDEYYSGSQEKLFEAARVVNPSKIRRTEAVDPTTLDTCGICFDDVPMKDMSSLDCEHLFCLMCWDRHLHTQVAAGTESITCPAVGCAMPVDEYTVSRLLQDPESAKTYKQLISRTFVRGNPRVVWCPSTGCNNAVKMTSPEARVVTCLCGTSFCFLCRQPPHDPTPCALLRLWLQKCRDDSATAAWITTNTKECPQCTVSIEKNGGCNHMTCRTCRHEFCWICMGKWSEHQGNFYQCNKFKEDLIAASGDKKTESRRAMERYLHYFRRFQSHHESSALEARLAKAVRDRQEDLQRANRSWIEVQYLKDALSILADCRSVLKFSYAFVFYALRNATLEIFEIHQSALEQATEELSEMLEKKTEAAEAEQRGRILDKGAYCLNLRTVLVKFVREGLESGSLALVETASEAIRVGVRH